MKAESERWRYSELCIHDVFTLDIRTLNTRTRQPCATERTMLLHICKANYLSGVSWWGSPQQQGRICRLHLPSVKMRHNDATWRHPNCLRLFARKTREVNACILWVSFRPVYLYIQHTKVCKVFWANLPKSAQYLLRYHQVQHPKFYFLSTSGY